MNVASGLCKAIAKFLRRQRFEILCLVILISVVAVTAIVKAAASEDKPHSQIANIEPAQSNEPTEPVMEDIVPEEPANTDNQAGSTPTTATTPSNPVSKNPHPATQMPITTPFRIDSITLTGITHYCVNAYEGSISIYDAYATSSSPAGGTITWTIEVENIQQPTTHPSYTDTMPTYSYTKPLKKPGNMPGPEIFTSTIGPNGTRMRVHITSPNSVYSQWVTVDCS